MSVTDHWHPSGRTAVYDVEVNLVRHTTMRMEA